MTILLYGHFVGSEGWQIRFEPVLNRAFRRRSARAACEVLNAIEGHVPAHGELVGLFRMP